MAQSLSHLSSESWDCIVVGGGIAGGACATALAESGLKTIILDRKRVKGGRTSSFYQPQLQTEVDNGQHLMMGAYRETLAYLNRVGAVSKIRTYPSLQLSLVGPDQKEFSFRIPSLPAPFNLITGLVAFRGFTWADRFRFLKLPFALWASSDDEIIASWIKRMKFSVHAYQRFWKIFVLATLNTDPEHSRMKHLKAVLKQGFLTNKNSAYFIIATEGLSQIFGIPCADYLSKRGGVYESKKTVVHFDVREKPTVYLTDGTKITGTFLVFAVPPDALRSILLRSQQDVDIHVNGLQLLPSPILSVHFKTNVQLTDAMVTGFYQTQFHWLFKKSKFMKNAHPLDYVALSSKADHFLLMSREQILHELQSEIRACLGKDFEYIEASVSWEKEATWLPGDSAFEKSLSQLSRFNMHNVFFAGDWTYTSLPGTIEAACASGHLVAANILKKSSKRGI